MGRIAELEAVVRGYIDMVDGLSLEGDDARLAEEMRGRAMAVLEPGACFRPEALERAKEVAGVYLNRMGYEVIERDWERDGTSFPFIAWDPDGELAFIDVVVDDDRFVSSHWACSGSVKMKDFMELEDAAGRFLLESDIEDTLFRFDAIALVLGGEHALMRHHKNVQPTF